MEISKEILEKIYIENKIKFQLSIEKDLKKLLNNNYYFILDYNSYNNMDIYRIQGILVNYRIITEMKKDEEFYGISKYEDNPILEITYLNSKGNYQLASVEISKICKFVTDKNQDSVKLLFECSEEKYKVIEVEII